MVALVNPFGLASTLDFEHTTGQTLVSGQTRLVTKTALQAPEGLLLKRVASFQEAVDAGGLFLYSKTNPTRWMFVIGKTLHRVLAANKLGIVSAFKRPVGDVAFKYKPVPKYAGYGVARDSFGNDAMYQTDPGGDFEIILSDMAYFGQSAVGALGIATGAEDGFGVSNAMSSGLSAVNGSLPSAAPAVGIGFAASIIPMNAPFSTFMRKARPALVAAAPSDIRKYYERTFEAVLAAYAEKDSKPTISVHTHWLGASITTPFMPKPKVVDTAVTVNGVYFWAQSTNTSYAGRKTGSIAGGDAGSAGAYTQRSSQKYRFIVRPGFYGATVTTHPLMEDWWDHSEKTQMSSPTGTVGALKVGVLRDGQLLKRSLVDLQLYASQPSSHADLAQLVNETIDSFEFDQGDLPTGATLAEAIQQSDLLMSLESTTGNIYQLGTLPVHITKFNTAWDQAAKALADEEN